VWSVFYLRAVESSAGGWAGRWGGGEKRICPVRQVDAVMKILRREEIWIHTHFVTDCTYLPDHEARRVRHRTERLLDQVGIVFGIHWHDRADRGLRIVLECIPLPETMQKIEAELAKIVEPIPSRPRKTDVRIEPPRRSAGSRNL
jgi:hypothetical protein